MTCVDGARIRPVFSRTGDRPLEERIDGTVEDTLEETTGVARVETVAASLGIDQPLGWGVFAGPDPRTTDRYYVFPAVTEGGERVDAYNERPLTFDRPHSGELQPQHDTYRERFYMNSVRRGGSSNDVPVRLAEHVCEMWPEEHGEELVRLEMYVIEEEITHETVDEPADRDREYSVIYRHGCGDAEPRVVQAPE